MYFDRFDICRAHLMFWTRFHSGQWSEGYRKLSQVWAIGFKPGSSDNLSAFNNENEREIYRNLYRREVLGC